MIIVTDEPSAYYFLLTSIVFVLCSSLLLFMFVPKIIFHCNPEKGGQKSNVMQYVKKPFNQIVISSTSSSANNAPLRVSLASMQNESMHSTGNGASGGISVIDSSKMN